MKKVLIGLVILIILAAGGLFIVNGKSNYEPSKYSLNVKLDGEKFGIGSKIDFTLPDQFDKAYTLTEDINKLFFVFTKDTGHIFKAFMADKPEGYLNKKRVVAIADISGMPVLIQNTFALPDFKSSNYSLMLIYDKEMAKKLKDGQDATKVIIMTLKDKSVIKVEHAGSIEELGKILD